MKGHIFRNIVLCSLFLAMPKLAEAQAIGLDIATYDDRETQESLRLFSVKGIEYYAYDSINQLRDIRELYYSFGEDYNYQIRLNTLK